MLPFKRDYLSKCACIVRKQSSEIVFITVYLFQFTLREINLSSVDRRLVNDLLPAVFPSKPR
jgi:hypothetical protein